MKEEEEERRNRERQCALSCLNKNKQLSDPIQTLKKNTNTQKKLNCFFFIKKHQFSVRKQGSTCRKTRGKEEWREKGRREEVRIFFLSVGGARE